MSERRKQFYTDRKIQGHLLVGLILLELVMVGMLLYFLYDGINQIIEQQLYQIHHKESDSSWIAIFKLIAWMMEGFLVVNLIALYVAHVVWARYVKKTVSDFSLLLYKLSMRDFSAREMGTQNRHSIVDLMEQWILKEKNRNQQISLIIEQLSGFEGRELQPGEIQQLQQQLQRYRQLLIKQ